MFPVSALDLSAPEAQDGDPVPVVRPRYLTLRDHDWIEALLDVFEAAHGQARLVLRERVKALRLPGARPRARVAMAHLLEGLHEFERGSPLSSVALRRLVFDLAASCPPLSQTQVWQAAADKLSCRPADVEGALYADLPGERRLVAPSSALTVPRLIESYNLALLQSLVFRAQSVRARLRDRVKPVLRYARLQRLLVNVRQREDRSVVLELSGPLSLFRHTTKYGRAMARWLPALTRGTPWALSARCRLGDGTVDVRATHRDGIATTHAPPLRFDSKVEERFFRELKKLAPDWEVTREAAPTRVVLDGRVSLVCPDFALIDPARGRRYFVEIVGFWTPGYLQHKARVIGALPPDQPWVLCVDRTLASAESANAWLSGAFFYERRVDVPAFLAFLASK